jgi:uncharacterized protein YegP (UPF0339 family)
MADVRFLIIFGPPSLDPSTMGFPPQDPLDTTMARHIPVRRRPVTTGELAGTAPNGWYAWRLMASNNRRLARSVTSFTSRPDAVDAIGQLRSGLANIQPHVLTDPENGSWGWRAERDGVPVATCPHWYERERDCRRGFGRFVDAVELAQVAEGGTILRSRRGPVSRAARVPSGAEGSRRWQAN